MFLKTELQFYNVFRLWSTAALNNVEFYALSFVQCFETFVLNSGEVNEHVVAAFDFDEAKSFIRVEPFNCTCLHVRYLQKLNFT